jgi:hypothetical protein
VIVSDHALLSQIHGICGQLYFLDATQLRACCGNIFSDFLENFPINTDDSAIKQGPKNLLK